MQKLIAKPQIFTALFSMLLLLSACENNDKSEATSTSSSTGSASSSSGSYNLQLNLANVQVHYPPPVVQTQDESIIVRGVVKDTAGITGLSIDGTQVTSIDGFSTWQAQIPLALGQNTLVLSKEGASGVSEVTNLTITRTPLLIAPRLMVTDTTNNQLLIWDNQQKSLIAIDLSSKLKTILFPVKEANSEGLLVPQTSLILNPRRIVLDPPNNRVLLYQTNPTTSEEPTIIAVDLSSGEQTSVENEFLKDTNLNELNLPLSVAMEESTTYIADLEDYLVDTDGNRELIQISGSNTARAGVLFKVDLSNGEKTILSALGSPNNADLFRTVIDMVTSTETDLIYLMNYNSDEVFQLYTVNKTSGERQKLSITDSEQALLSFINPKSLELDASTQNLYVLDNNAIVKIDLNTHTYSILSSKNIPEAAEYPILKPTSISLANGKLYLVDDSFDYVLEVDTTTGSRSFVAGSSHDNSDGQSSFFALSDTTLDAENHQVFNLDKNYSLLNKINLLDGLKSNLPITTAGEGEHHLNYPICSALNQTKKQLIIFDNNNQNKANVAIAEAPRFFTYDIESNELDLVLSSNSANIEIVDMAYHEGRQSLYLIEKSSSGLIGFIRKLDFSKEIVSSSILSHNSRQDGIYPFRSIKALAVDYAHNRLLVVDSAQNAVVAVDLDSGVRSQFSNAGYPTDSGPRLEQPKAIVVDHARNRALILDSSLDAIMSVDLETGLREIVITNVAESNNKLYSPTNMDLHPIFNYLLLIDSSSDTLMAIDLINNQKVILSR